MATSSACLVPLKGEKPSASDIALRPTLKDAFVAFLPEPMTTSSCTKMHPTGVSLKVNASSA